jgi:hypothetical protein
LSHSYRQVNLNLLILFKIILYWFFLKKINFELTTGFIQVNQIAGQLLSHFNIFENLISILIIIFYSSTGILRSSKLHSEITFLQDLNKKSPKLSIGKQLITFNFIRKVKSKRKRGKGNYSVLFYSTLIDSKLENL